MSDYFHIRNAASGHAPEEIAAAVRKLRPVGTGFLYGALYDLAIIPAPCLMPLKEEDRGHSLPVAERRGRSAQLDEYEGFDRIRLRRVFFSGHIVRLLSTAATRYHAGSTSIIERQRQPGGSQASLSDKSPDVGANTDLPV